MKEEITPHCPLHGGCLISDTLKEAWLDDWITEAVVLSPGEAVLFFGRHSKNKELPYCKARNVEFGLGDPFNWAGRSVQIEALTLKKTIPECHHAILKAVVEKKTRARGPGWPWEKNKAPQDSSCGLWCWGVDARLSRRLWWRAKMKWWNKPWT